MATGLPVAYALHHFHDRVIRRSQCSMRCSKCSKIGLLCTYSATPNAPEGDLGTNLTSTDRSTTSQKPNKIQMILKHTTPSPMVRRCATLTPAQHDSVRHHATCPTTPATEVRAERRSSCFKEQLEYFRSNSASGVLIFSAALDNDHLSLLTIGG